MLRGQYSIIHSMRQTCDSTFLIIIIQIGSHESLQVSCPLLHLVSTYIEVPTFGRLMSSVSCCIRLSGYLKATCSISQNISIGALHLLDFWVDKFMLHSFSCIFKALIMEGKAHCGYRPSRGASRISHDLSEYQRSSSTSHCQKSMLRRMASQWKIGRTPHVGIVGAGVAGLRCAEVLIEQGIKVTIIEARDRIGGRVCPPIKRAWTWLKSKGPRR